MIRDVDRLTARTYDVLVVGGGIHGLTIACDAAERGLAVALIDAHDFGSGSSFNHLRTIHGGLRYLQALDVGRARESIRERRALACIAPHAVRPTPFVLPLTRSLTRGAFALRAGFLLDRITGIDRNAGVSGSLHLPAGRVLTRVQALELCPDLLPAGLTAAALWYDYTTPEPDRLTFSWAMAAHEHGATLVNYVEARSLLVDGRRVRGVRAIDRRRGRDLEIEADVTVNATGGQTDRLLTSHGLSTRLPLLKAMNLVTRLEAGERAVAGRSAGGNHFFVVPWKNRALFGTWISPHPVTAEEAEPTESDVFAFISELRETFPALELTRADVTLVHRGLVPGVALSGGRVALETHEQIVDHLQGEQATGVISVAGTKYTTARAVAERVTDRIVAHLRRPSPPCRTAVTPLPGGYDADQGDDRVDRDLGATVSRETLAHLTAAYGSRRHKILDLASQRPEWGVRVAEDSPVIGAELIHAARHEMAMTLSDAVVRRTPLGAVGFPGDRVAARAAELLAAELGWSGERIDDELADLRQFYVIG